MSYFEEHDPSTGERSSFGGIAEASAEYHARGEMCPWDCWRCDPDNPANQPALGNPVDDHDVPSEAPPAPHGVDGCGFGSDGESCSPAYLCPACIQATLDAHQASGDNPPF